MFLDRLATPAGLRLPASLRFLLALQRSDKQGDVFGTISSALVFGVAREEAPADSSSSHFEAKGVCDMLTMDKLWFFLLSFTSRRSGPLLQPHEEHLGEW